MTNLDLTPLYRSSIGFDRLGSLLDTALRSDQTSAGYPPYDIAAQDDNLYEITLAVAGFAESDIEIQVEKGVLTVKGRKANDKDERRFLYRGIASRAFERKFNLAEFIEVAGADLNNGLLTISLVKKIPEAMKPRTIAINRSTNVLERQAETDKAA